MKCDKCKHTLNCPAKEEHGGAIRCSAFKPQEMTNEDWLRSASTEELAEWIYQLSVMDRINQPWYFTPIRGSQKIVEWLKQPHTKE